MDVASAAPPMPKKRSSTTKSKPKYLEPVLPSTREILDLQNQQEFLKTAPPMSWSASEVCCMQKLDPDVKKVYAWVEEGVKPSWQTVAQESYTLKSWWAHWDQLVILSDKVLYLKWEQDRFSSPSIQNRVVTPRALQPYIFRELHDAKTAAHLGIRKTLHRAYSSRFYWPGMGTAVTAVGANCIPCGAR
jgi:hypothetical protein